MGSRLLPKLMTLNVVMAAILRYSAEFGSFEDSYVTVVEVRSILCATNMQSKESRYTQLLTYGEISRGF